MYDTGRLPGVGVYATNVATGNFIVNSADMDVSHRGVPFVFARTYNSQSLHETNGSDGGPPSLFGNGWTNTFDSYIALGAGGTISVYDDSGARMDYLRKFDHTTPVSISRMVVQHLVNQCWPPICVLAPAILEVRDPRRAA